MKAKTKRLLSLTSLMVIFAAGCAVIFYNLRGNLVFFYSPTELIEKEKSISQKVRLGGMVKKNSVEKKMITENDIRSVRPGFGLPPKYFDKLIGTKVRMSVEENSPVTKESVNLK